MRLALAILVCLVLPACTSTEPVSTARVVPVSLNGIGKATARASEANQRGMTRTQKAADLIRQAQRILDGKEIVR